MVTYPLPTPHTSPRAISLNSCMAYSFSVRRCSTMSKLSCLWSFPATILQPSQHFPEKRGDRCPLPLPDCYSLFFLEFAAICFSHPISSSSYLFTRDFAGSSVEGHCSFTRCVPISLSRVHFSQTRVNSVTWAPEKLILNFVTRGRVEIERDD